MYMQPVYDNPAGFNLMKELMEWDEQWVYI